MNKENELLQTVNKSVKKRQHKNTTSYHRTH